MSLILKNVTKKFDGKYAVKNINLEFSEGIYGLLGANGAGKTTLIRCICDLYKIEEGGIYYYGKNIQDLGEKYRELIGFLPQDFGFYPDYTAFNFLVYLAAVKGLKKSQAIEKANMLLQDVGLFDVRHKKLKKFSGGMIRRIGIAQALLNEPKILILDEPTAGLDPKERIRLKNILSRYSENNTIIISTHIVSDVEYIAKEIVFLKQGTILNIGTRTELLDKIQNMVWKGTVSVDETEELYSKFKISSIKNEGNRNFVRLISDTAPSNVFELVSPNLDDLYLYYFEEVSISESII